MGDDDDNENDGNKIMPFGRAVCYNTKKEVNGDFFSSLVSSQALCVTKPYSPALLPWQRDFTSFVL